MTRAGTVSQVSNKMKAERGAVTCLRSLSKSRADFQQPGLGLDSFPNPALQGEAGKEGNQEGQGCPPGLQKVESCKCS